MNRNEVISNYIDNMFLDSMRFISSFKYKDGSDPQALYCIVLFSRILALSSSIPHLLRVDKFHTIPIVVRTIFEAFVDLANISKDIKYIDNLTAVHLFNKKTMMQYAFDNPESPYHKFLSKDDKFVSNLQYVKNAISKLKRNNIKKPRIIDKMKNFQNEYRAIYYLLSRDCHNDIFVLEENHIKFHKDKIEVNFSGEYSFEYICPSLQGLAEIYIDIPDLLTNIPGLKFGKRKKQKLIKSCERAKSYILAFKDS